MKQLLDHDETPVTQTNWLKILCSTILIFTGFTLIYTTMYMLKFPSPMTKGLNTQDKVMGSRIWFTGVVFPILGFMIWKRDIPKGGLIMLSIVLGLMNFSIWWAILRMN
jgi:predicted tellurium resistance membrane protein TerC